MFSPRILNLESFHFLRHGQVESAYSSAMVVEHLKLPLQTNGVACVLSPVNQSACLSVFHCRMSLKNRDSVNTVPTAHVIGPLRL